MNFLALLDKAKAKLKDNDPFFQERTGLVLDILRSKVLFHIRDVALTVSYTGK